MKTQLLVLVIALLSVGSVRADTWSVAINGNIVKVEAKLVDGKVYIDAQSLLALLGHTASIDVDGKVIAIQNQIQNQNQTPVQNQSQIQDKPEPVPDLFDRAMRTLKDICSAAKVGIVYVDYTRMARDAQISIDRFGEKYGEDNPNTKNLRDSFAGYVDARDLWQAYNDCDRPQPKGYLPPGDKVVKALVAKYPDLNKQMEKIFFTRRLKLTRGLEFLWNQAQTAVEKTKRVADYTGK